MRMRRTASPWRKGKEDGFRAGLADGEHLGRCRAIVRDTVPSLGGSPGTIRPVSVLYVKTGLWAYAPLDEGVIDALRGLVRDVHIAAPTDDVAAIASTVGADLVLALNSVECLPVRHVDALRELGIKTAAWFTDDPYYSDVTGDLAPHYDYVFTLEESCVPFYRDRGCAEAHFLPFGVNTAMYEPKRVTASYRYDIVFIGSAFWNRVAYFDRLAPYLRGKRVFIAGYWWDRLKHYSLLADRIRLGYWVSSEETASFYNGAKIVINMHRAIDDESNRNSRRLPAQSVNPRSFEIGACGTLQLTDGRVGLPQAYEAGREIAVYGSPEELIERVEHYLNHEEERRETAYRSLHRTMEEHTYLSRVSRLLGHVFG
ncbi:CgeB family protein [Paenibacillus koleovorans]|uniref:CgeB family protein n=1 Tax=Paenibacillus koleovorans TaxID=121608 RepID=UPI001FE76515|nr:glycosyltransferase [Paenibacillus koleovorans]